MKEIIITRHAISRIRERMGINKKSCQKVAEKAYENGLISSDVNGELYRYILWMSQRNQTTNTLIKLYGDKAFVFNDKEKSAILITVIPIPTKLKNKTLNVKRKKESKIAI